MIGSPPSSILPVFTRWLLAYQMPWEIWGYIRGLSVYLIVWIIYWEPLSQISASADYEEFNCERSRRIKRSPPEYTSNLPIVNTNLWMSRYLRFKVDCATHKIQLSSDLLISYFWNFEKNRYSTKPPINMLLISRSTRKKQWFFGSPFDGRSTSILYQCLWVHVYTPDALRKCQKRNVDWWKTVSRCCGCMASGRGGVWRMVKSVIHGNFLARLALWLMRPEI